MYTFANKVLIIYLFKNLVLVCGHECDPFAPTGGNIQLTGYIMLQSSSLFIPFNLLIGYILHKYILYDSLTFDYFISFSN